MKNLIFLGVLCLMVGCTGSTGDHGPAPCGCECSLEDGCICKCMDGCTCTENCPCKVECGFCEKNNNIG